MNLWDSYLYLFDTYGDPRVKGWFLMSSPLPTIALSLIYALGVKKLGPKLMENRKPFELRRTIIAYNFLQVLLSSYLFYQSSHVWFTLYSYPCQPVDYISPIGLHTAKMCYIYFISKFTEYLDTIFFVLRKRNHQVSALHVIHHAIMPVSVWWGVKFCAGGSGTFFGFLNTFVHIIMYSYYLVAALGPQFKRYLWWKKYLTVLQMVQFTLVMVHASHMLYMDCDYPKAFVYVIFGHAVLFFYLFYKFFDRRYFCSEEDKLKSCRKTPIVNRVVEQHRQPTLLNGFCFPGQEGLLGFSSFQKLKSK